MFIKIYIAYLKIIYRDIDNNIILGLLNHHCGSKYLTQSTCNKIHQHCILEIKGLLHHQTNCIGIHYILDLFGIFTLPFA